MQLFDLVNKYHGAQIITHTDLDGYGAGAILIRMLTDLGFDINDIKVTNTDYSNAFPVDEKYNLVFVSDISISNDSDAKKLMDFANNPNNIVFWFDHHKTSLEMSEKYPDLAKIPGLRDTSACGAMLCWIFYQAVIGIASTTIAATLTDVLNALDTIDVESVMDSTNPGIWFSRLFSETPTGIFLTDDYDRFVLSDPSSKYYMEAFNSYPAFERDCKSEYFQQMYSSRFDNRFIK
jgi:oligoribonuclease NrnB/cAMP/cGMP phosphodiesterase (DHH superfamily)